MGSKHRTRADIPASIFWSDLMFSCIERGLRLSKVLPARAAPRICGKIEITQVAGMVYSDEKGVNTLLVYRYWAKVVLDLLDFSAYQRGLPCLLLRDLEWSRNASGLGLV